MKFWYADAHSCLPLRADTDIAQLKYHYDAGVRYVSINVGMDLNPLAQVMRTIASFRRQIDSCPWMNMAGTHADILRIATEDKLAISFDLEGALPLLESPDMVALYHRLGVRQIHLAYNRNNSAAGGAHDVAQGLSALGACMVDAIHDAGILMDLSHSSEKTALDICAHSGNRPVLYSHANPSARVAHGRNVSDAAIKAVAATGGLVCLNGVGMFVGDNDLKPASMLPLIDHVVQLIGAAQVGIGLDYCYDDGVSDLPVGLDHRYWWPPEAGYHGATGLNGRYITPEAFGEIYVGLDKMGYAEKDIQGILRDNLLELIQRVWRG